jgi:hypothetical protein
MEGSLAASAVAGAHQAQLLHGLGEESFGIAIIFVMISTFSSK